MTQAASVSDIETQTNEARMAKWGFWSRRTTERLGLPAVSNIAQMMEHVVQDLEKPKKRLSLKEARRLADAKLIAIALNNAEEELTAKGKQTDVRVAPKIGYVDPEIMTIDRIVADLSGRFQKMMFRRYVFLQPDRIAAKELRMDRDEYTDRANETVRYVCDRVDHLQDSVPGA